MQLPHVALTLSCPSPTFRRSHTPKRSTQRLSYSRMLLLSKAASESGASDGTFRPRLPAETQTRTKAQWESTDTLNRGADVRYLQVGLSRQQRGNAQRS